MGPTQRAAVQPERTPHPVPMRSHSETAFISLLELVAGTGREMRGQIVPQLADPLQ